MSFTFNTYKGHREYGVFKFHEENKHVFINSARRYEDITPLDRIKIKIIGKLTGTFKVDFKVAQGLVEPYKYMNGIMFLNPEYVAAVLAMQILYHVYIKVEINTMST